MLPAVGTIEPVIVTGIPDGYRAAGPYGLIVIGAVFENDCVTLATAGAALAPFALALAGDVSVDDQVNAVAVNTSDAIIEIRTLLLMQILLKLVKQTNRTTFG